MNMSENMSVDPIDLPLRQREIINDDISMLNLTHPSSTLILYIINQKVNISISYNNHFNYHQFNISTAPFNQYNDLDYY